MTAYRSDAVARPARTALSGGPAPAFPPVPRPRPPLSVVPDPRVLRSRRLCRLFTALAGLAACFGLFGVVGVRVLLAQGQDEVERLSAQVREQEERQQRLRLQVAELESPERVVSTARERLGMVPAVTVVPLAPASLADPPPTTIPSPRATTTTVAPKATSTTAPVSTTGP